MEREDEVEASLKSLILLGQHITAGVELVGKLVEIVDDEAVLTLFGEILESFEEMLISLTYEAQDQQLNKIVDVGGSVSTECPLCSAEMWETKGGLRCACGHEE
jgi:hypothetical protein